MTGHSAVREANDVQQQLVIKQNIHWYSATGRCVQVIKFHDLLRRPSISTVSEVRYRLKTHSSAHARDQARLSQ